MENTHKPRMAFAYAKPEWLVTYVRKDHTLPEQDQTDLPPKVIREAMASNGHIITSMCRVGDGYRRELHQLALDLAWFNTHP